MNIWQERIKLLKNRGSIKAVLYWLIKKAFHVEFYFFYTLDLAQRHPPLITPEGNHLFSLISLSTHEEIKNTEPALIDKVGLQCGQAVNKLIENNAIIYALIDRENIVSQVNIQRNALVQVDSPTLLNFHLAPKDTFLGYLFTYTQYRGQGTAPLLLQQVCNDLQKKGISRIITHIRATNTPSLNTFEKCEWIRSGWMISTTKGRVLAKYLPKQLGISISKIN